jgi:hypothetical protein
MLFLDPNDMPDTAPRPVTESQLIAWGKPLADPSGEAKFLQGPQKRSFELWQAFKIFRELIYGFRKLHFAGPCVTVFGSARFDETHRFYKQARLIGRRLAEVGFTVMTGGGPGIMEAANRGAKDVKGAKSIGCNIILPMEQEPNPYLDKFVEFEHFFVRKLMLIKYSYAFIVCPGGFGTLDELFEVLTLIQTGKAAPIPVILMDTPEGNYWIEWYSYVQNALVRHGHVSRPDLNLVRYTTDPERALAEIALFYRNYVSMEYEGERLIVRLRHQPTPELLARLEAQYGAELLASGRFEALEPTASGLHGLGFHFRRKHFGRLRRFVDELNLAVRDIPATSG